MGAYVGEQPERTREAARRMPLALCLAKQLNEDWHRGQRHHERTLKSYLLQEGEGVSRVAKLAWCAQHGCTAINLQHDGVVVRLTDDWPWQRGVQGVPCAEWASLQLIARAGGIETKGLRRSASVNGCCVFVS